MAQALHEEDRGRPADRRRFEDLFEAEWPKVVRVAQRVLGDLPRAEDAAQEAFLSMYRRYGERLPERPGPWLYAAAAHVALNALRSETRREQRERREYLATSQGASTDPSAQAERSEENRELRRAMARLKAHSAEILALRYGGLTYQEIAQTLAVPVSQVGTRLRRAEAALRKEMEDATPR